MKKILILGVIILTAILLIKTIDNFIWSEKDIKVIFKPIEKNWNYLNNLPEEPVDGWDGKG